MSASFSTFNFPPIYHFPPFFTLQPHSATKEKQIKLWLDLIREYCSLNRIFTFDADKYLELELFKNKSISRSLSIDFFHILLAQGVQQGYMQWITKDRKKVWILWRSFEEWGKLILDWAKDHGFTNTVLTGYEVRCGEMVSNQGN
ncbi:Vacuolar protein-sorting-associated protein 25, partial [Coelomomyces lativittatus]